MNTNTRNLLLKLKNSSFAKLDNFYFKYSEKNVILLEILYNQGFIQSYTVLNKTSKICVILRYFDNKCVFDHLKIFSKNLFLKNITFFELSRLFNKRFVLFLTTNKGILNAYQCKTKLISGKIFFSC